MIMGHMCRTVKTVMIVGGGRPSTRLRASMVCFKSNQSSLRRGEDADEEMHKYLLAEAAALSRSLYRTCLRSVKLIRAGNENDEREFAEREKKRLEQPKSTDRDVRLSFLSMLPPVDRADELRSRAEYYTQYARELFVQESDCLPATSSEWSDQHVYRYVHHLRRGNEHRHWLLSDMKFDDSFSSAFDLGRVNKFESEALSFASRFTNTAALPKPDNDEDPFGDDSDNEDDGVIGLPSWYKNPRSQ